MTAGHWYKLDADLAARRDLPPAAKIVFAVLAGRAGERGRCWPGFRRLAADCGVTDDCVEASIARLEGAGLVTVQRRANGQSNVYRFPETARKNRALLDDDQEDRPPEEIGYRRPKKPGATARKNRAELEDQLNEGGAAAPPGFSLTAQEDGGNGTGAGGLVALWVSEHERVTGRPYTSAAKARARLGGCLKNLLADHAPDTLAAAVRGWFAKDRREYGAELFVRALQGGDRDLLPRRSDTPQDAQALAGGRKLAAMMGETADA